jgi:hypothetical protein
MRGIGEPMQRGASFMKTHRNTLCQLALIALLACGQAFAGGLVELPGDFDGTSNIIDNPWYPLPPGQRSIWIEEADDECQVIIIDVIATANQSRASVNGVLVREVLDTVYLDESGEFCENGSGDPDDWELLEITLDWFAQDVDGNVWYTGEHSVATDHEECDHPSDDPDPIFANYFMPTDVTGCLDGSWEAGYDIWEDEADEDILAGIYMLADPQKGDFYFQEYWEDEATDMAKVLNFKDIETFLYGPQEGCLVTKDWVPLEPGSIEQKTYCYGLGQVLEKGVAGGKTAYVILVGVIDP